ncbi:MAG: M56 family metallopeptidase [Pseudomonadota bacterium]
MTELAPSLLANSVQSGALLALLIKGTLICLMGVYVGTELSAMPAVIRHRVALCTVCCMAVIPLLAALLTPWELPILARALEPTQVSTSLVPASLTLVYVGTVVMLLLRLGLDVLCIAQLDRRARGLKTADQLLPGCDHPRGSTPVKFSEDVLSPLTWGWLRPRILVPVGATEWKANDMSMVLQHELAHVQRMDWAAHLLARCVYALYWPVPGIRVLIRQLSLSAEQACDDRVLAAGEPAPEYAAMLLRQAQGERVPASVSLGHSTELGTRIRYLVAEIVDHSASARGAATTYCSCLALTLTVATAQLGQRPEIPVVEWGSVEPDVPPPALSYPKPTLHFDETVLAALEPGPARPLPPPAPRRPPRFTASEKPTVPPP